MKNIVIINEKSFVLDGKDIGLEVVGWSYGLQVVNGERAMVLSINRRV